jgi:hypothetical protein
MNRQMSSSIRKYNPSFIFKSKDYGIKPTQKCLHGFIPFPFGLKINFVIGWLIDEEIHNSMSLKNSIKT